MGAGPTGVLFRVRSAHDSPTLSPSFTAQHARAPRALRSARSHRPLLQSARGEMPCGSRAARAATASTSVTSTRVALRAAIPIRRASASSALCELRAQAAQLHSQSSLARGSGQHGPSRTRDVSERGASGACGALARNWEENDSKKGDFWGPAASPRLPEKPPCLLGVRGRFLLLLHQHRLQATHDGRRDAQAHPRRAPERRGWAHARSDRGGSWHPHQPKGEDCGHDAVRELLRLLLPRSSATWKHRERACASPREDGCRMFVGHHM